MAKQETSSGIGLQLTAVADFSNDTIIGTNKNSIITSWNRMAEITFGYAKEEAIGKHINLIVPEDKIAEDTELLHRLYRGDTVQNIETTRLTKDGRRLPFSISISPSKNNKGDIIGAYRIGRDLTNQKLEEERNAILAAIVSSSDDAIISKTLNGIVTSWNKAAERIFGYTEKEAIGRHITFIIPPHMRADEDMIISEIKKGNRVEHFETKRIRKDGSETDLSITVSPVKNKAGEIVGASKVARDIADMVKARNQLETYAEELKNLNRYKDDFISVASHELNTPLTSLKVYLTMLKTSLEAEKMEASASFSYIQKSIYLNDKLIKLVKDLLDVSRIEAGKMELQMSRFDCLQLLQDTVDSMKVISGKHIIEYESEEEHLLITGDKDRLEQVFINLLSNAIKYSPAADRIVIRTKKDCNGIQISVQDFGIGIPDSEINNIFCRFYRATGLAKLFSGLGIGLYVSSEIVHSHGGNIFCSSKEGKGSVFTVTLPLTV